MSRIIDLSQSIHQKIPVFPTYPQPCLLTWCKRENYFFQSNVLFMSEHTGTHLDAPYHLIQDGKCVDEISPERLMGEALAIRVKNTLGKIGPDELERAISEIKVKIKAGDRLLLRTGWETHWTRKDYVTSYPGLTLEGAKFLSDLKVSLVGIDTPNIDHPQQSRLPVHNVLLSKDILIIENICNTEQLIRRRFQFAALPLKLKGGTGSPTRAVAIL